MYYTVRLYFAYMYVILSPFLGKHKVVKDSIMQFRANNQVLCNTWSENKKNAVVPTICVYALLFGLYQNSENNWGHSGIYFSF